MSRVSGVCAKLLQLGVGEGTGSLWNSKQRLSVKLLQGVLLERVP